MTYQRTPRDLARGLVDGLRDRPTQPGRGSARMFEKFLVLVVTSSVVGCVSKSNEVRTRAAFDLGCSGDKLVITPLTSEAMETATYGVQGCSKKATYVYTPGAGAVLNSPVQTADK